MVLRPGLRDGGGLSRSLDVLPTLSVPRGHVVRASTGLDVPSGEGKGSAPVRMALCLLLLALLPDSAARGWEQQRYVAFGGPGGWGVMEVHAKRMQWLTLPAPYTQALNLTVTADGRVVVFTAEDAAAHNVLLFRWRRTEDEAHLLGEARGFHAEPSVSPDGRWAYFSHNPEAGGPPGAHPAQPQAFAQLYRVSLDGTGLQRLTNEKGCHYAASFDSADGVDFIHTDCRTVRKAFRFQPSTGRTVALDFHLPHVGEPRTAPDGARTLATTQRMFDTTVLELSQKGQDVRQLFTVPNNARPLHAVYGGASNEILYQAHDAVFEFDGTASHKLFDLPKDSHVALE